MRIKVVGDRLLIKLSDADNSQYKGALIIPDTAKKRVRIFEVVNKGEAVTDFEVGDKVLISFYTGIYIDIYSEVEPENLRIVTQEEVLAKLIEE